MLNALLSDLPTLINVPGQPDLSNHKMLTFTHQHSEGFTYYHIVLPQDCDAPKGTIGGDLAVDEMPELWEKYQIFIELLDIEFDPEGEGECLWCSEEPVSGIKVASENDLCTPVSS